MGVGVAIAALAALLLAGGGGGAAPTKPKAPSGSSLQNKQRLYAQLEALPMLDEDQRLALMLIAHGETGGTYNPASHNDSKSERKASSDAYDSIADRFSGCGRTASEYKIGSVGRFQRLAPYFANDLRHIIPCVDPQIGFDGLHDIASAVSYAHWLTTRAAWNGRVSGLRGGWATPGWVDAQPAEKLEKWRRHADEAGLMGPGVYGGQFLDREIKPFPSDIVAVLVALKQHRAQQGEV